MTREEIHDLLLGAVVVVLGYALYKHFKAQPSASAPLVPYNTQQAIRAAMGNYTTTGPTSPFTSINDLLTGTVHDIGGFGGVNYGALMDAPINTNYW